MPYHNKKASTKRWKQKKDEVLKALYGRKPIPITNKNIIPIFVLSIEELKGLKKFLYASGYISHEFHQDIHVLGYRIDAFLKAHGVD